MSIPWRDWNAETFAEARREKRPILLNLTTRWAQAARDMDRGAYADTGCVQRIEQGWLPVRVLADQRPDIDLRYQMGGWPSTVFLTPEGDIIGGATYVEPGDLARVLDQILSVYRDDSGRLYDEIRRREARISQVEGVQYPPVESVGPNILQNTLRGIAATFDPFHGGFGSAPKFTYLPSLEALLVAYSDTGGEDFRSLATRTLDVMAQGLLDARRGGFFRFCVRQNWSRPHTEKLLEDNARQARIYAAAANLFGEPRYAEISRGVLEWMRSALRDPATGAFASALAADEEYYAPDAAPDLPAPPRDPAVLIAAAAQAVRALLPADDALSLARFLLERAWDPDAGVASALDTGAPVRSICRPHVELADALIDVYEHTADASWLDAAFAILERAHEAFWHVGKQGLVDREPGEGEVAPLREGRRSNDDNGVAARAWLRIAEIRDDMHARERAHEALLGFPDFGHDYGHTTAEFALAADLWSHGATIVKLRGDPAAPAWRALRDAVLGTIIARRVVRHERAPGGPVARVGESEARSPEEVRRLLRGE